MPGLFDAHAHAWKDGAPSLMVFAFPPLLTNPPVGSALFRQVIVHIRQYSRMPSPLLDRQSAR
jgi:hypothetical protein